MQAQFDLERELSRELYMEVTDDNIDGHIHCTFHTQIELYFVEDGQVEALINNQRKLLEADQMAVALSYDTHLFRSVGSSRSSVLVIPPHMCEEFTTLVQGKQVANPFICDAATVRRIKTYVDAIRSGTCNPVLLRGYIGIILGIILDTIFFETVNAAKDTELSSKLLIYLGQNFKEQISLSSLSAQFGYNQSYLSRYFRQCFGIGLFQYVNILRLRNALLLMKNRKHTHTYCALESGFPSVRTFYRVFQSEMHCSPREYLLLAEDQSQA